MQALLQRESQREFAPKALRKQTLVRSAVGGGRHQPARARRAYRAQRDERAGSAALRGPATGTVPLRAFGAQAGIVGSHRRAPSHRLSGLRRQRAAGPRLRRRPRADEADPGCAARGIRLRCGRRDGAERVPVLRLGRARHGDSRLVRPPTRSRRRWASAPTSNSFWRKPWVGPRVMCRRETSMPVLS